MFSRCFTVILTTRSDLRHLLGTDAQNSLFSLLIYGCFQPPWRALGNSVGVKSIEITHHVLYSTKNAPKIRRPRMADAIGQNGRWLSECFGSVCDVNCTASVLTTFQSRWFDRFFPRQNSFCYTYFMEMLMCWKKSKINWNPFFCFFAIN